jgi:hypothetical protein
MPLNERNSRNFHRMLRAGTNIQAIVLYKRGDNQAQGTVTTHKLFGCWREESVSRIGETVINQAIQVEVRATWNVPKAELDRVGIIFLNVTDKIYDPKGKGWWTPYSSDRITELLMGNYVSLSCHRTEPS